MVISWQEKSTDESRQRALLPSSQRRSAAANKSPRSCNSTALAPRKPLCPSGFPVHDLPSQSLRPNGGYYPTAFAVLVNSLRSQCRPRWVLTHVPFRLRPGEKSPLQHAATRRHRTQCYEIFRFGHLRFRKVTYFAKETASRCRTRLPGHMGKICCISQVHIDKSKKLEYTVTWSFLRCFRKVCYFAKNFCHF